MASSAAAPIERAQATAQAPGKSALDIVNVSMVYGAGDERSVQALDNVSLSVREGEFVAVIGPSGCGKSTLFGIIGGLIDGFTGQVLVDGHPVDGSHRDIGMVFQEESTFPWRTVLDNVAFPLEVQGVGKAERHERARHFIRLVGLEGFADYYPSALSGGMRQRTAVARTLAFEPRLMLLDEPFGALDEQTRMLLGDKLLDIRAALNQTMLLITHSITEAVQLADRIVVMSYRPGRIKRTVEIDLPRPRSSEVVATPEFGGYVGTIWSDLREEASRGMAESEGALAAR